METDDWRDGMWEHINFQAITDKVVRGVEGKDRRYLPPDVRSTISHQIRLV